MDPDALIGVAVFLVSWVLPVPLAGWILSRKGYSPHWMWIGILPIAGLFVLGAAILLTARSDPPEASGTRLDDQDSAAWSKYEKGMRELGNGLIALGAFAALISPVVLLADTPILLRVILGTLVFGLATLYLVLGVFARKLHAWVNYVVVALGCLGLIVNLMNLSAIGQDPEQAQPGSHPGVCCGFLIAAALLYYSINNIQNRRHAKDAGTNEG